MLEITPVDRKGYFHVTGYADGSDWLLGPETDYLLCGTESRRRVWLASGAGAKIFDARTRRRIARVELTGATLQDCDALATRDGKRLGLLVRTEQGRALHVISLEDGTLLNRIDGVPRSGSVPMAATADGRFLIAFTTESEDGRQIGLAEIDPDTGTITTDILPTADFDAGFFAASPTGRFWLRKDWNGVPVRTVSTRSAGFLPVFRRNTETRWYGAPVQVWESRPLRCVRTITTDWLTAGRMAGTNGDAAPAGQLLDTMAARLEEAALAADEMPPRWMLEEIAQGAGLDGPELSERIIEMWGHAGVIDNRSVAWQEDEQAIWFPAGIGARCVGLDGSASPVIELQRFGPKSALKAPHGGGCVGRIVPLPGRRAQVEWYHGTAELDGSPSDDPEGVREIAEASDGWQETPKRQRLALDGRIDEIEAVHKSLDIRLPTLCSDGCIPAINKIQKIVPKALDNPCVRKDMELEFAFHLGTRRMTEAEFFDHVKVTCEDAVPDLLALLQTYNDAVAERRAQFWNRDGESAALSRAVRALGVLSTAALPEIEAYAWTLDRQRERFFITETVPSIIEAHGWTDPVMDFGIWVLLAGFEQGFTPGVIWNQWGLGRAARSRNTARDFGQRVLRLHSSGEFARYARTSEQGFIDPAIDAMKNDPAIDEDKWMTDFYAELTVLEPVV